MKTGVKTGRGEGPEPALGRGEVDGGAAKPRVLRASGGFVPAGQGSHQCPPELGRSFARCSAEHLPDDRLGAKYGVVHTGLNRGHLDYGPRREVVTTIGRQLLLMEGQCSGVACHRAALLGPESATSAWSACAMSECVPQVPGARMSVSCGDGIARSGFRSEPRSLAGDSPVHGEERAHRCGAVLPSSLPLLR